MTSMKALNYIVTTLIICNPVMQEQLNDAVRIKVIAIWRDLNHKACPSNRGRRLSFASKSLVLF
jgi:hypothetical protein